MPLPIIPLHCYPCFHACHVANVQNTARIEALGAAIMATKQLAWPQVDAFVGAVCAWGGYAGIAGRVRKNNAQADIISAFSSARDELAKGHTLQALSALMRLHSLGQISFASKHLRMLSPVQCGVLDALVVGAGFGYQDIPASFGIYCSHCSIQARLLNNAGIVPRNGRPWNAGAVDMAVFAWIRNRNGNWNCGCGCIGEEEPATENTRPVESGQLGGPLAGVRTEREFPDSDGLCAHRIVNHISGIHFEPNVIAGDLNNARRLNLPLGEHGLEDRRLLLEFFRLASGNCKISCRVRVADPRFQQLCEIAVAAGCPQKRGGVTKMQPTESIFVYSLGKIKPGHELSAIKNFTCKPDAAYQTFLTNLPNTLRLP
jgi:hypothetical protein